jgi:Na+-transporting NADH:ubiquinone oxidoreductase subunit NqrB
MRSMIETISFIFGLSFSLLVYFRSIRPLDQSRTKKAFYLLFTLIGITGMLFLSGVLIAHFLRKMGFSV